MPVISWAILFGVRAHDDSLLRDEIRQKAPDANVAVLANATIESLCATPGALTDSACETDATLAVMQVAAVGAGTVSIFLLVTIWAAGRLARNNRALLAAIFRPGLYITLVVLVGLVVTSAALAIASIYFGETALINRLHVGIILAIGLGALGGVLAIGRGAFAMVKKAETTVIGKVIRRDEAPELWKTVEAAAERLGALKPESIVLGLDPNFFVTEVKVHCLSGSLTGRTLYCSLPLTRILAKGEFLAILGHELGHFKGEDTKFSERFYPVYRGTATALAHLQAAGGKGAGGVALIPAVAVLGFFFESFALAEKKLSRERELAADRAGASVASARDLAVALAKVHAFSGVWGGFDEAALDLLRQGKQYTNASTLFAAACEGQAKVTDDLVAKVANSHVSHPTDSHPSLSDRLQSLGLTLAEVRPGAIALPPASAASSLIADCEKHEEEISGIYQALLARNRGITLPDAANSAGKT